jgi:hypothetical protein
VRALGIAVEPGAGSPKLFGVIVSGTPDNPVLEDEFEIRTSSSDAPEQVADLARLLQAKLPGIEFDEAAIRVAGNRPVASRFRGNFSRAHAEGAALYVLRERIQRPIGMGNPQSFAGDLGETKQSLIDRAKQLSNRKADAAIAAIAALNA